MGVGIVGGRLHPDRSLGVKAAAVGARILQGEDPASIQSPPIEAGPPTFDWRELQRWHIAEDRLPPESAVLFRPPSFWRLYRWYVLGVLAIVFLQMWLITVLLLQRRRRNRAERQFAQSERKLHMITDSLPVLIAYVNRDQRYVFNNRTSSTSHWPRFSAMPRPRPGSSTPPTRTWPSFAISSTTSPTMTPAPARSSVGSGGS